MRNMKIEISLVVIVSILMIGLGIMVFDHMDEERRDRQTVIQSSTILKDKDYFDYAVETEQGHVLPQGTIKAIEGFKFKEMNEKFMHVEKIKEVYTMHTRRVKSGKHSYRTQIYWTWDHKGTDTGSSKTIDIFGNKYSSKDFDMPGGKSIDASKIVKKANGRYYKTSSHVRYSYRVFPMEFKGAFLANAKDGTIKPPFKDRKIVLKMGTAKKIVEESKESKVVFFWTIWALSNIAIALVFLGREEIAVALFGI